MGCANRKRSLMPDVSGSRPLLKREAEAGVNRIVSDRAVFLRPPPKGEGDSFPGCAFWRAAIVVVAWIGVFLPLAGCPSAFRQSTETAQFRGVLGEAGMEGSPRQLYAPEDRFDVLSKECSRAEAEEWAGQADANPEAGLKAAACYVVLARSGKDKRVRLADARRGRALADKALKSGRQNGLAHYVMAHLAGLEAENNIAQGLRLVPVIEREALEAADLDPRVDHGGPDRLLGELYLRAPGFPMSVGDSGKAVVHFRRAVEIAPGHSDNRLGLVEALLAEGENMSACRELRQLFAELGGRESASFLQEALELMDRMCSNVQ